MNGMGRVAFNLHNALTRWEFSPFALLVLAAAIVAASWYIRAELTVSTRGRRWSGWRTASFMAGLVAVVVALQSPVSTFTTDYFQAHVIQHLLLMVVAPPLLAMGAPMTLALQTSPRSTKRALLKVLHSPIFGLLTHPILVFFLYYLSMYAFFLTGALGYAMDHMWLMDLINLGFLGGATLFWWPMVGQDPIPRWNMNPGFKMINLLIGVPIESFLGVALLMKATPVASMYTLASTHTGGGVLWAATEFATVVALAPIYSQWTK